MPTGGTSRSSPTGCAPPGSTRPCRTRSARRTPRRSHDVGLRAPTEVSDRDDRLFLLAERGSPRAAIAVGDPLYKGGEAHGPHQLRRGVQLRNTPPAHILHGCALVRGEPGMVRFEVLDLDREEHLALDHHAVAVPVPDVPQAQRFAQLAE